MINDHNKDIIYTLRVELATAYRFAYRYGFSEGICNHFSLALPDCNNKYLLIPYGVHWSEVCPKDFIIVNDFGEKISGEGYIEPTAFNIHGAIHKRKTDANCVMHTHMQSTLALSMLVDGKLEMSDQNACRFYNRIAYMNDYNGLVLDDLEANKIVDALGNKDILFLACHGVIVVGKDVSNAWEDLYYLDRACRAQLLAMQTGKPLRKISDEIALKVSKQVSEETLSESSNAKRHLESLRKILVNEGINEFNVNS